MIQVYFEPDKKWWKPWNKDRFLVEGKDFEVTNGRFILVKYLKGKITTTYEVVR